MLHNGPELSVREYFGTYWNMRNVSWNLAYPLQYRYDIFDYRLDMFSNTRIYRSEYGSYYYWDTSYLLYNYIEESYQLYRYDYYGQLFLTASCQQSDISLCRTNSWYWHNNDSQPLNSVSVKMEDCSPDFCIEYGSVLLLNGTNNVSINLNGTYKAYYDVYSIPYYQNLNSTSLLKWERNQVTYYNVQYSRWQFFYGPYLLVEGSPGYANMPSFTLNFTYTSSVLAIEPVSWYLGQCRPTSAPTLRPTAAPTPIIECAPDYFFTSDFEGATQTVNCPFGYRGTHVTARCDHSGYWVTQYDDCEIISFTDDFSYRRKDIWRYRAHYDYSSAIWDVANGHLVLEEYDKLGTHSKISGPSRIEHRIMTDDASCNGYGISRVFNFTLYGVDEYASPYLEFECYGLYACYNDHCSNNYNDIIRGNGSSYDVLWVDMYGNGYAPGNAVGGLLETRAGDNTRTYIDIGDNRIVSPTHLYIRAYGGGEGSNEGGGSNFFEFMTFDMFRVTTFVDHFGPAYTVSPNNWTDTALGYDLLTFGEPNGYLGFSRYLSPLWTDYANISNSGIRLSSWLQSAAGNSDLLAGEYNYINTIKFNYTKSQENRPFLHSGETQFQFQSPYTVRGVFLWLPLWDEVTNKGNNGSIRVDLKTKGNDASSTGTLSMECAQEVASNTYSHTVTFSWTDSMSKSITTRALLSGCFHSTWATNEMIMLQFEIQIDETTAQVNISNPFYYNSTQTCAILKFSEKDVPVFTKGKQWTGLTIGSGSVYGSNWLGYIDVFQGAISLKSSTTTTTTTSTSEAPAVSKDEEFYEMFGSLALFIVAVVGTAVFCCSTAMISYCFVFKRNRIKTEEEGTDEDRKNTTAPPGDDGEEETKPRNPLNGGVLKHLESENDLYETTKPESNPISSPKQNKNMIAMMQTGAPGSPLQLVQLIPVKGGNAEGLQPKSANAQITAQPSSLFESFQKQQQLAAAAAAAQTQRTQSPTNKPKVPPKLPPQPKVEMTAGHPVVRLQSESYDDNVEVDDLALPGSAALTSFTGNTSPRKNEKAKAGAKNRLSEEEEGGARPEYLLDEVQSRVDVNALVGMSPIGEDGQRRLDANRAKLLLAKYRGVGPTQVSNTDPAIAFLVDLSVVECKQLLASCPNHVANAIRGKAIEKKMGERKSTIQDQDAEELYDSAKVNFLTMFTERCNIKQVYTKLASETKNRDPTLDARHARIFISNLRDITFAQVTENDPGVLMLTGKTMSELRDMLSNIELEKVRLLDLKSYYSLQQHAANSAFSEGENLDEPQGYQ